LRDLATHLKNSYKTVVLTAPTLQLPQELEKDVTVLDFDLPTSEELRSLLDRTVTEVNENTRMSLEIDSEAREMIIRAALGLTLTEAENVFAKTLVMDGKLDVEDIPIILSEKEQIIRKSGLLEFFRADERMSHVGGLEVLKDWLRKRTMAFTEGAQRFGLPAPKGILMIGVQGCGKSLCAKAAAALWQMPLLRLDMGRMFSSLVGSSEENMRKAIRVAESVAPALLWIDEIEKGFAGSQSSTFSDAGTTSRVFGGFMTWLQEKTSPVFVVATANDISQLPPELLRKGRFDEIFFVDLPAPRERAEIAGIHLAKRQRDPAAFDLAPLAEATDGFSGAEIEQAIVSALFDAFAGGEELTTAHVLKACRESIPLSRTMREAIDTLRSWADGRARPASLPSPEAEPEAQAAGRRRLEME
jgi:SpoVK/Ycf46/Vps4 family AAA+-type ATPase